MDNLFLLLFFISIVSLVLGVIKPSIFSKFLRGWATRKGVTKIFGIAAVILFILFGITTDSNKTKQIDTNQQTTKKITEQKTETQTSQEQTESKKPLSEEEQIRKLISEQLKGDNNLGKPYIRKIDVIKQVNGGWGVFVEYNADDNLTKNLRKIGIEKKMSEIYIALYTSGKDIRSASVSAYFPLVDKYGNESDGVVYKSILDKKEADKINWNSDPSTLKLSILPGVWTTSILHPEFR